MHLFKQKLLILIKNKQLSTDELNFIKTFNTDEELFDWTKTLNNNSGDYGITKQHKNVLDFKSIATGLMTKINNTKIQH
jgi:hypothetical protein